MPDSAVSLKSVATACSILDAVSEHQGPISLKQISLLVSIAPSKAHRYVQSLCASGYLAQSKRSGLYDLGLKSLRVGVSAIGRVNYLNRISDELGPLAEAINADAFLTIWSEGGPIVIRAERASTPGVTLSDAGTLLPLLTTTVGQVFVAFDDRKRVMPVLEREAKKLDEYKGRSPESIFDDFAYVKKQGFAVADALIMRDRYSASAPVLSFFDTLRAVVSFVSLDPASIEPENPALQQLLAFCKRNSLYNVSTGEETEIERNFAV